MKATKRVPGLREVKSTHSIGMRSIPKVQRSSYLELYTLGREKERWTKEISELDRKRGIAVKQLESVLKRVILLQKETSEEGNDKIRRTVSGKPIKTMAMTY